MRERQAAIGLAIAMVLTLALGLAGWMVKFQDRTFHAREGFVIVGLVWVIAVTSMLLLALNGFSVDTNVTAVLACLNNIGPGLDNVGPMGNYGAFSPFSKLVLIANMLIGRLEILPMFTLFAPSAWKR